MSAPTTRCDGSSPRDRVDTVRISRTEPERYRYRCPRGHTDWDRTNNHIWCRGCRRQSEAGDDVDPEWWKIVDTKTGRTIPWSAITIVTTGPQP